MSIDAIRSVEIGDGIEAERAIPAEQTMKVGFPTVVPCSRNHLQHNGLSDDERIRSVDEFGDAPERMP